MPFKYSNRTTIEDTIFLNINHLVKSGLIVKGMKSLGTLWPRSHTGQKQLSCLFSCDTAVTPMEMNIFYTLADEVSSTVLIYAKPCHFGGQRLYFVCPECGRLCWSIYLKQSVKCRKCHKLTYKSCKESHCLDGLYKRMAKGSEYSWYEMKNCMQYLHRIAKRRPKRPRGRPRRPTPESKLH